MEDKCDSLIQKLLADGTIIRTDRPATWCSPARFVRKANGYPCLVINYRGLNTAGSCSRYPFSFSEELHHKVKDQTAIFITLDLANSYFQLQVKLECIHLFTFSTPQGKFSMTRCSQGHHDAGDQLNINTR